VANVGGFYSRAFFGPCLCDLSPLAFAIWKNVGLCYGFSGNTFRLVPAAAILCVVLSFVAIPFGGPRGVSPTEVGLWCVHRVPDGFCIVHAVGELKDALLGLPMLTRDVFTIIWGR